MKSGQVLSDLHRDMLEKHYARKGKSHAILHEKCNHMHYGTRCHCRGSHHLRMRSSGPQSGSRPRIPHQCPSGHQKYPLFASRALQETSVNLLLWSCLSRVQSKQSTFL